MRIPSILTSLVVLCSCAASPAVGPIPPVETAAPAAPEQIGEKELRAHVQLLASDSFEGRGTLESGEQKAASYLSKEFQSLGLTPLPGTDDYRISAELIRKGFEPKSTTVHLSFAGIERKWSGGVDFKPFWFSKTGNLESKIVFAGYGISRPDLGYDDYEGLEVAGKVVFVLRHAPKKDEDDKRFENSRDAFFSSKAKLAMDRGAVGMILVTDPRSRKEDDAKGGHGGDDLRMTGRLSLPPDEKAKAKAKKEAEEKTPAGAKAKKEEKTIFALHISAEAGEQLAVALGMPLGEIQAKLDAGQLKPSSLRMGDKATIRISVGEARAEERVKATNVVGLLPGSDPKLRDEWVVVGAHFDHLGSFEGDGDTVFNGADDNASGTSAMLAVARNLAQGPRPRRSVAFVGFSAEEKGLLGSRSLVRGKLGPEQVRFMVNMDMLGRNGDKAVYVGGDGYARGLADIVTSANEGLGLNLELGGKSLSGNSDHYPFYARGIPVMNLFTGLHDDYHQLSDHADKLDYPRMAKIATLAARVTRAIAGADAVPRFIHRPMWLGVAIEVHDGGALVTEVEADSPGGKAGMQVGDVITAVGKKISFQPKRISELLGQIEPGSQTAIGLSRGGAAQEIQVRRNKRGYLGVFPRPTDEATQKKFGLAQDQGVVIRQAVKGGPAAKAGIQKDDILVEIAGKPVGIANLGLRLARIGAGEKVPVLLIRAGQRVSLTMILGERPKR